MTGPFKRRTNIYLIKAPAPRADVLTKLVREISHAEMLALHGSPIQLLAAPGAGFFISPKLVLYSYYGGAPAYTLNTVTQLRLSLGTYTNFIASCSGWITSSQAAVRNAISNTTTAARAQIENAPLQLTVDGSNDLTDGTGAVRLVLYYAIEAY
jgi:hypothetical protein